VTCSNTSLTFYLTPIAWVATIISLPQRFFEPPKALFLNYMWSYLIITGFTFLFHTWKSLIQNSLCSDWLVGYNHLFYSDRLLSYKCLLNVKNMFGCNCLLYVNFLLDYNLVKSWDRLCDAILLFLPLCVATCHSYFCRLFMCRIHSSVDIC
jgi:hypothetical protein